MNKNNLTANTLTNALTPVTLMNIFANAFKIESGNSNFWLKGIFRDRQRESYNGYYFDRLQDELGGQIVTIKLPEHIKQMIQDGNFYLFKGILDKDIRRDGVIEPVFIVTEIATQLARQGPEKVDKRNALRQQKADAGYRDFDEMVQQYFRQNRVPHIAFISGKTSVVLQDVYTALQETKNRYQLTERKVNLSDKQAIIRTLIECNSRTFDAISIVRGGGPGLEIFDDVTIAEASLTLQPLLLTAIGHAEDETLLQQLADKKFTTPTALGNHLRELAQLDDYESIQQATKPTLFNLAPVSPLGWIIFAFAVLIIGVIVGMMLSGQ